MTGVDKLAEVHLKMGGNTGLPARFGSWIRPIIRFLSGDDMLSHREMGSALHRERFTLRFHRNDRAARICSSRVFGTDREGEIRFSCARPHARGFVLGSCAVLPTGTPVGDSTQVQWRISPI